MADTYSEGSFHSFLPPQEGAVAADTTFRLFQKWLDMCATTRGEFARLVRDRARDRGWTSEELDSCLSWLGCADEGYPMPPRLVDTVLDQVMAASGEAAAVTRRMTLLHQAGIELA